MLHAHVRDFLSEMGLDKRNLKCRRELKESSSRERELKFQYFVQKAVIIQTLGVTLKCLLQGQNIAQMELVPVLRNAGLYKTFQCILLFAVSFLAL